MRPDVKETVITVIFEILVSFVKLLLNAFIFWMLYPTAALFFNKTFNLHLPSNLTYFQSVMTILYLYALRFFITSIDFKK